MKTDLLKSATAYKPEEGLNIVRIAIALILIVHAVHGLIDPAGIHSFGEGLSSDGFPLCFVLAWLVMVFQFAGCVALIVRRLIIPACICNLFILIVGVFYIHISEGWFVVGGGRNGMEFSVTLISCLSAIMWAYWPRKNKG